MCFFHLVLVHILVRSWFYLTSNLTSVQSDVIGIFFHDPVLQKREKQGVPLLTANGMDLVAEVRVEVIIEAI